MSKSLASKNEKYLLKTLVIEICCLKQQKNNEMKFYSRLEALFNSLFIMKSTKVNFSFNIRSVLDLFMYNDK